MHVYSLISSAEQILAASKASIAPPPRRQVAGGSFAGVKAPVRNWRTKSVTPEASDGSEVEIEMETDRNEKKEEQAGLEAEIDTEIPVKDKNDGKKIYHSLQLVD
jgi:hypothetical protein